MGLEEAAKSLEVVMELAIHCRILSLSQFQSRSRFQFPIPFQFQLLCLIQCRFQCLSNMAGRVASVVAALVATEEDTAVDMVDMKAIHHMEELMEVVHTVAALAAGWAASAAVLDAAKIDFKNSCSNFIYYIN